MLTTLISMIANILFCILLNVSFYTDRAPMPDGSFRQWRRSPADRLSLSGQSALLYLQFALAAVSVVTGILALCGVKSSTVRTVQLIASAASAVLFVVILIVTGNSHAKYA